MAQETNEAARIHERVQAIEAKALRIWGGWYAFGCVSVTRDEIAATVSGMGAHKAKGLGPTIDSALDALSAALDEQDPRLLAATLGIEAA